MINSVLGEADCIDVELSSYVKSVVGPAPELQLAVLVIEGEPGDVYLAGGLEDARGYVGAAAPVSHHHVGGEGPVKLLVSAAHFNLKFK